MAGCFIVETAGQYGLMHVYGADPTASPPIPGFKAGEALQFRVNGIEATPKESVAWQDDKAPHRVDLSLDVAWSHHLYLPLVKWGGR